MALIMTYSRCCLGYPPGVHHTISLIEILQTCYWRWEKSFTAFTVVGRTWTRKLIQTIVQSNFFMTTESFVKTVEVHTVLESVYFAGCFAILYK